MKTLARSSAIGAALVLVPAGPALAERTHGPR
jgi:hypothetical protein